MNALLQKSNASGVSWLLYLAATMAVILVDFGILHPVCLFVRAEHRLAKIWNEGGRDLRAAACERPGALRGE